MPGGGGLLPLSILGPGLLGCVTGWLGENQRALASSLRRSHALLQTASDGIHVLDEDGNLLEFNDTFMNMLGYTRQEMRGMNVAGWDAQWSGPELLAKVGEYMQRPGIFETRHKRKDGSLIEVEINAVPTLLGDRLSLYASARDITSRKEYEAALRESEERFRSLFSKHSATMLLVEPETGAILDANPSAEKFYGYDIARLREMNIAELNTLPPEQTARERLSARLEKRNYFVFPHRLASGEIRTVEVHSTPIALSSHQVLFSIIHDITDREQARRELQNERDFALSVMNTMGQGLTVTNEAGVFEYINPAFARMIGRSPAELTGMRPEDITERQARKSLGQARADRHAGKNGSYESRLLHRDGSLIDVQVTAVPRMQNNQFAGSIAVITDLSERKRTEAELTSARDALARANQELTQVVAREQSFARTDSLTGIYNRRYFYELAATQVSAGLRYHFPVAAMLFDVDFFKQVNDTYGHQVGDRMLEAVARLTKKQLRDVDLLGRYGGDEFVILLPHTSASQAVAVGERIRQSVWEHETPLPQGVLQITVSVGISELHGKDDTLDKLIKRADQAMYRAKQTSRNRVDVD
jgi:diguanylate cyclase (GGDEF)-like protein/PAS domain S-box-containing protein